MKKASVCIYVSLWFALCHASNVLWDNIEMYPYTNGPNGEGFRLRYYHDIDLLIPNHSFWVDLYVTCSRSGLTTTLTADPGYTVLMFDGNWVQASPGYVAMESTTRHLEKYFMHCYTDNEDPMFSATPLVVRGREQDIYLMFTASSWGTDESGNFERSPYYYGWVQLTVTPNEVLLVRSAINLDGEPIIVGTGNVPEPSSFLLLAVGGVILALKRARVARGIAK